MTLTAYQSAAAAARNAGRLFLTHAIVCPGFSSPADLPGLGLYTCPKSGLEIVLTRSGAVDSKATKARRVAKEEAAAIAAESRLAAWEEAAADLKGQEAAREEAARDLFGADLPADFLADLESELTPGRAAYALECVAGGADTGEAIQAAKAAESRLAAADLAPAIESGPVGPDWKGNGPAESFYAQAPALPHGRPGPFAFGPTEEAAREALARRMAPAPFDPSPADIFGPGEETPADLKARRAAFVAAFALAPIKPALESPLFPMSRGAGAVALAIAQGACDVSAMIRGKGPTARQFIGGF